MNKKSETNTNDTDQTIDQAGWPVAAVQAPETETKQPRVERLAIKRIFIKALLVVVGVAVLGGIAFGAKELNEKRQQQRATRMQQHQAHLAKERRDKLVNRYTFIRYGENDPYEKDKNGEVKKVKRNGYDQDKRKPSFTVDVEHQGATRQIKLDDKTQEVGYSTNDEIYTLSCSGPELGKPGADTLNYSVTFYDRTGSELRRESWTNRSTKAPADFNRPAYGGCTDGFHTGAHPDKPRNFSPRQYGTEKIDSLNYRLFYQKSGSEKQEVARETEASINIPVGMSPNKQFLLYNRVSAKRVLTGCGEVTQIPYKIPDFFGPINELRMYDLSKNKDTNLGVKKSFEINDEEVTLSANGTFTPNSSKYFIEQGGEGGCRGGGWEPIRVPYIDLHSGRFDTVRSPKGKVYTESCLNATSSFMLMSSNDSSYQENGKTHPPSKDLPSILNTETNEVFQIQNLDRTFMCHQLFNSSKNFVAGMFETRKRSDEDQMIKTALTGLRIADPEGRTVRDVSLDRINFKNRQPVSHTLLGDETYGYLSLGEADDIDPQGETSPEPSVWLFDLNDGQTVNVPTAQIVF